MGRDRDQILIDVISGINMFIHDINATLQATQALDTQHKSMLKLSSRLTKGIIDEALNELRTLRDEETENAEEGNETSTETSPEGNDHTAG